MAFSYMVGEVERVDEQYVATRFFAFVGPLVPTSSMFITSTSVSGSGRSAVFRYGGVGVKLNAMSVVTGYLRVWLPILALAYPFLTHWGESVHFGWESPWLEVLGLFAAWIVVLMVPGRLSSEEKARRRVLRQCTGLAVDPRRLLPMSFTDQLDRLKARANDLGFPDDADACLAKLDGAHEDLAPLYARARYGAVQDAKWQRVADAVWPKVRERGLKPMFDVNAIRAS